MYFAFGWPKVLAALEPGAKQEEVVYLFTDQEYFVLVSTTRIQLWTGGQHRVKLGTFTREAESIQAEGLNRKAYWSSVRRSLAVLVISQITAPIMQSMSHKYTERQQPKQDSDFQEPAPNSAGSLLYSSPMFMPDQAQIALLFDGEVILADKNLHVQTYNNVLHVYGMHTASEPVLAASLSLGGPGDSLEFKRVDLYLQQSQALGNEGASACDVVGDGRSLLLGYSDGSLQLFSWQAKVTPLPTVPLPAVSAAVCYMQCHAAQSGPAGWACTCPAL